MDGPEPVGCVECGREVGEDYAERERWTYWSDGTGDLLPYCSECAEREFGDGQRLGREAPAPDGERELPEAHHKHRE